MQEITKPQASGYSEAGASRTRRALRGFIPNSTAPKDDIDRNNGTLRQRARMLFMSSPIATAAINTNRTHIIGTGLSLQCSLDGELLGVSEETIKMTQRKIEAEFRLWSETAWNCDALGINNFGSLQQLALKTWLTSGDAFALITRESPTPLNPYSLRIHIIEADRICTPTDYGGLALSGATEGQVPAGKPGAGNRIFDGVEVDKSGKVVAYHICDTYPNSIPAFGVGRKWTRVLARGEKTGLPNILPIMDSERCDQYRGVPYLAQVIEPLLQLRRYTESELMAALVQSFFTAWIESDADQSEIPINEVGEEEEESPATGENEYQMGPATVVSLQPGEKVQFGNPNIPTAGFESFVKTICKLVGAALEIPYDVLCKEFNSSYSASRGALMEAWEAFKMRRKWFVDDFCTPIYEIWLSEAIARGRVKAPGFFDDPLIRKAWCGATWVGPVQVQLDPVKEATAAEKMTNMAIKTRKQVTRELGSGDWDKNIAQIKRENELLADAFPSKKKEEGSNNE